MREKHTLHKVRNRIHYIVGQFKGIEKMFAQNKPLDDILIQFLAVQGAVKNLLHKTFHNYLLKELAARISSKISHPATSAKELEQLRHLAKHLSALSLKEIIHWLNHFNF